MKIKNIAAVLLLIWTCGFSSVVSAAEIQTVQLTEENQLVYTKDKTELAGAFDGMAPGDSRTVVIKIENQNSHKASFFISQKTTDALEEAGKASEPTMVRHSVESGAKRVCRNCGKVVGSKAKFCPDCGEKIEL